MDEIAEETASMFSLLRIRAESRNHDEVDALGTAMTAQLCRKLHAVAVIPSASALRFQIYLNETVREGPPSLRIQAEALEAALEARPPAYIMYNIYICMYITLYI